jgi:UDP-N-acetylglucosamine--N-acetylmuramyl-(pentapeptide) pyrophosphoryl-undecaprenol N-acetylglucosamine transferase
VIGWYIHHQGSGHRTRAATIAAALDEPVVGLSSLPPQPGFRDWVQLPPDDAGGASQDPTARGTLHWAPRRDAAVAARVSALAGWLSAARPRLLVVDVSVEAALLARLAGIPVVVVALPGDRADAPHQQAYALADLVLACWRPEVYDPPWLHPHRSRTTYVGAVSRYDGRARQQAGGGVLVLDGEGGGGLDPAPLVARGWRVLGGAQRVSDPWPLLCGADVVVSHAGQNALAELAAARARVVVVPQPRPFAEQQRTAAALAAAGIAELQPDWDADWQATLARAEQLDPQRWTRWSHGDGAARAAHALARLQ